MPRLPRIQIVGLAQHVVQRGVDRQAVFFGAADYSAYLCALRESAAWYGLAVHAYCLMTNHVHLLVTPTEKDAVSRTMRRVGSLYVGGVNRRYRRTGTLWEGRYRSCVVDSDNYLLACQRYIELNPVRAGMVAQPQAYRWSSHAGNGFGQVDPVLTPHAVYLALGASAQRRFEAYRELFTKALDADTVERVRTALQRNHILGGERFRRQVATTLARNLGTGRRGRPAKVP